MSDSSKRTSNAIIKVIGVGGGGGNAINTMIESGLEGVEFIAANTDIQALQSNKAPLKIQLGRELTKGLGAGANPDVGHDAALEDKAIIQEIIGEADMVFVTAGMGGGTGTGAAPVIAQVAREMGALTVGVVTKPFIFEGKKRKNYSETGIQQLRASVDTLITIPNQRLLAIAPPSMSMLEGFRLADDVLLNAVKGISEIINIPGRINVDFADVKTVMSEMGMALMGTGIASGSNRATEAAQAAISSPLLEDVDIEGATGLLINITGPENMSLHEISVASSLIQEAAHEDANIILGAAIDPTLHDELRVTVIATGFDQAYVSPPETRLHGKVQSTTPASHSLQTQTGYGQNRTLHSQTIAQSSGPTSAMGVHFPVSRPSSAFERSGTAAQGFSGSGTALPLHNQPQQSTPAAHERTSHNSLRFENRNEGRPKTEIEDLSSRAEAERLMTLTMEMAREEESAEFEGTDSARFNRRLAEMHSGPYAEMPRAGAIAVSQTDNRPHEPNNSVQSQSLSGSAAQRDMQSPLEGTPDAVTQRAMQIALEFSDDEDYERPAFLRQKEADRT